MKGAQMTEPLQRGSLRTGDRLEIRPRGPKEKLVKNFPMAHGSKWAVRRGDHLEPCTQDTPPDPLRGPFSAPVTRAPRGGGAGRLQNGLRRPPPRANLFFSPHASPLREAFRLVKPVGARIDGDAMCPVWGSQQPPVAPLRRFRRRRLHCALLRPPSHGLMLPFLRPNLDLPRLRYPPQDCLKAEQTERADLHKAMQRARLEALWKEQQREFKEARVEAEEDESGRRTLVVLDHEAATTELMGACHREVCH